MKVRSFHMSKRVGEAVAVIRVLDDPWTSILTGRKTDPMSIPLVGRDVKYTGWAKKNKQNLKCRHFNCIYLFELIFSANDPHHPRLLWWKNKRNQTSSSGDRLVLLTPCQKPSQQLLKNWCYRALASGSFNTLSLSTIFCSNSFFHLSRGAWWPSRAFEEYSRV